ncbi:hypothetical protein GCM10023169_24060 [Georgenia halophila]|uniref:Uncharacterized protein n=1 Tax=Georgenia halophila TaxID=620889 RepID=A0ABP8LB90_9MICO
MAGGGAGTSYFPQRRTETEAYPAFPVKLRDHRPRHRPQRPHQRRRTPIRERHIRPVVSSGCRDLVAKEAATEDDGATGRTDRVRESAGVSERPEQVDALIGGDAVGQLRPHAGRQDELGT